MNNCYFKDISKLIKQDKQNYIQRVDFPETYLKGKNKLVFRHTPSSLYKGSGGLPFSRYMVREGQKRSLSSDLTGHRDRRVKTLTGFT